jgi:excisionase family DNA binding protein
VATAVEDPFRTPEFVQEFLSVNERWFRRAVAEKRLEVVKCGALIRVRQSELDRFVAENTRPAESAVPPPAKRATVRKRGSRSTRVPA